MKTLSQLEFYALIFLLFNKAFKDGKKHDYASRLFGFGNYKGSKESLTYKIQSTCESKFPGPRYIYDRIMEYNRQIGQKGEFDIPINAKHLNVFFQYIGCADKTSMMNAFQLESKINKDDFKPNKIQLKEDDDDESSMNDMFENIIHEIAGRIAVATDVDKTLTKKTEDAYREFIDHLAPVLLQTVKLGTPIIVVTGNSMEALASRFMRWMIGYLWKTENLVFLPKFHFFFNSGGVYAHFPIEVIDSLDDSSSWEQVIGRFLEQHSGRWIIRPEFIDPSYVKMNEIREADRVKIDSILNRFQSKIQLKWESDRRRLQQLYKIPSDTKVTVIERRVQYGKNETGVTQITLKPVMGQMMALKPTRLTEDDERARWVKKIQKEFNRNGLNRYTVKSGGTSSIDVTLGSLTKEVPIRYMIDQLGIHGNPQLGEQTGSRVFYLGDEVFIQGNDFSVTRIPGIVVFAVNHDRDTVPFLSNVVTASKVFEGTEATQEVLQLFNQLVKKEITIHKKTLQDKDTRRPIKHGVALFKEHIFRQGIQKRVQMLLADQKMDITELHEAYILITLLCRETPAARKLIEALVKFLDNMSNTLDHQGGQHLQGLDASRT